jgi:NAD(P)-dependent dehydrogenase (short-subunit alcohol dehydrogenase family)
MNLQELAKMYDFTGKTFAVTGGAGVLCSEIVRALVGCGANVAILDLAPEPGQKLAQAVAAGPGKAIAVAANVLDVDSLKRAADEVVKAFGTVDGLVNGAGGNKKEATTSNELSFFNLPKDALQFVFDLNIIGTILPSQAFGKVMAEKREGVIVNISSMNSFRPLTRVPAYSAAKAGISNFTQWLAVHLAQEYSPKLRVNAIAPGFFLTDQNRFLLTQTETGELTARGQAIIAHTPMARFGDPEDLLGAVLWLLSPASAFVSGVVIPIDGGFSAFSGV